MRKLLVISLVVGLLLASQAGATAPAGRTFVRKRGQFEIEKMGLQNGIPLGAQEKAIKQLRSLPQAPVPASWQSVGPQPISNGQGLGPQGYCGTGTKPTVSGRVTSIAFGGIAGTIYLGTAGGGVWKSTNNGVNWTPLTDQQVTLAIGALAVVPKSNGQDIIYAGTGESNQGGDNNFGLGILKSQDGGSTWTQMAAATFQNMGFARIALIPGATTATDVLYAATMQTTIGSSTSVASAPPVAAGLFKSVDGGANWTTLSGNGGLPAPGQSAGSASDVAVSPVNNNVVFAGLVCADCTNGGVWMSQNAGVDWQQVSGVPNQVTRVALSMSPDGNTVYGAFAALNAKGESALTANYISSDGGGVWTKIALPPAVGTDPSCLSLGQADYDLAIQSDPSNPAVVYEALIGIYKSTDSGASWTYIGSGIHSDFHAIAINGASLFGGSDGGIFFSTDGGTTWDSSLNIDLSTLQFQSIAGAGAGTTTLVGGTQDNGTDVYSGSLAWTQMLEGDGGITALARTNPTVAFSEYFFEQKEEGIDHAARFTIGGTNVAQISPPFTGKDKGQFYTPLILDPNNDNRLMMATNRIWESCSGASFSGCNAMTGDPKPNWRAISDFFPTSLSGIGIAPSDPATLYAVTDVFTASGATQGPKAFVTRNSIAASPTYTEVSAGLTAAGAATGITSVSISPANPAMAAVSATGFTGGGKHVFLTQNSGQTWTDISTNASGFPDIPALTVLFDKNDVTGNTLFAGTSIGILETTNLGQSWTNLSMHQLPTVQVYDIKENADTLTIATHGRGVWQLQIANPPEANATWSTVNGHASAGKTATGGTLTLTNTGSVTESVNSIMLSLDNPNVFSQVMLTSGGSSASADPAGSATVTLTFSPPVQIAAGASASFLLSAVMASGKVSSAAALAGMVTIPRGRWSATGPLFGGLFLLGLLKFAWRGRLNRAAVTVIAMVAIAVAVTAAGCGGSSSSGGSKSTGPKSFVVVPSGGVNITNGTGTVGVESLPALLGKLTRK